MQEMLKIAFDFAAKDLPDCFLGGKKTLFECTYETAMMVIQCNISSFYRHSLTQFLL